MGTLYLLDTNILVHFVRDSRVWRRIVGRYDLLLHDPTPLISVVSIGELRAIARRNGWGLRRLSQADYICSHLLPVTIGDDPIFNAYALDRDPYHPGGPADGRKRHLDCRDRPGSRRDHSDHGPRF